MTDFRTIKLIARKHFAPAGIAVLSGPAPSIEQRMVAQYEEVHAHYDRLAERVYEIGRDFLTDLNQVFPENETLQCLRILNNTAFAEPGLREAAFLAVRGPRQVIHGLNVLPGMRDAWDCLGIPEKRRARSHDAFLRKARLTEEDIYNHCKAFKHSSSNTTVARAEYDHLLRFVREQSLIAGTVPTMRHKQHRLG